MKILYSFIYFALFIKHLLVQCNTGDKYYSIESRLFLENFYMFVAYGKFEQLVLLTLNVESDLTTQSNSLLTTEKSQGINILKHNIEFKLFDVDNTLYGHEFQDQVMVGPGFKTPLSNFNMILSFQNNTFHKQISNLAFAHIITNTNHSLVYLLYEQGLIGKRTFCVEKRRGDRAMIHFGGLPPEVADEYNATNRYILTEVTNIKSKYWLIPLNSIYIGKSSKHVYNVNKYETIISNSFYTLLPYDIMKNIIDGVFKEKLYANKCSLNNDTTAIECDCDEIRNGTDEFGFVIGSKALVLNFSMLFRQFNEKRCLFMMKANFEKERQIKFGVQLQSLFLIEYDYDNHSVKFMSKSNDGIVNVYNGMFNVMANPVRGIIQIIIVVCFVFVVGFILRKMYVNYKTRKVNKFKNYVEKFYSK